MTIDSISHGRFGVNLVTGWQKAEYDQMGMWPGDEHYKHRYETARRVRHRDAGAVDAPASPTSRASTTP